MQVLLAASRYKGTSVCVGGELVLYRHAWLRFLKGRAFGFQGARVMTCLRSAASCSDTAMAEGRLLDLRNELILPGGSRIYSASPSNCSRLVKFIFSFSSVRLVWFFTLGVCTWWADFTVWLIIFFSFSSLSSKCFPGLIDESFLIRFHYSEDRDGKYNLMQQGWIFFFSLLQHES